MTDIVNVPRAMLQGLAEAQRDRFAMAALTGLIANPANREPADVFAKTAYAVADAMMEARNHK